MHVAIDLTALAFNFSGIEQYAFRIVRELVRIQDGTTYTLVFYGEPYPGLLDALELPDVQAHTIPARHANKLLMTQRDLPGALRKIEADAYLFPAFPRPLTFWDSRSITVIHDVAFWDCPETLTRASLLYWRVSARHASRCHPVITVSEFSKGRICERLGMRPEQVVVAPDAIDESFSAARKGADAEHDALIRAKYGLPERFILSLCTLEPRKNLNQLVEAWVEAREAYRDIPDLVLAGRKGWMVDELLSEVPERLKDCIHLTGFVDNEDLPHTYRLCDRFVCPSRYEGFGLPPLEALASGAAVLCSDIPVFHETCDGLVGFFPLDDPHALAALLSTPAGRPSDEQREALCQRFSWQGSAVKLHDALVNG